MCGRFTLTESADTLIEQLELAALPSEYRPRYNIAPSQPVLAVSETQEGRKAAYLRWGLVPSWAKDPKIGHKMINARAETISQRPSFRTAFERRRCLIPADGFYEWRQTPTGKSPVRFRLRKGRLFAFAGLWETWRPPDGGAALHTCTMITTQANPVVEPVHHRMPVILDGEGAALWLDPDVPGEGVRFLLKPYPAEAMEAYAVSRRVNTPKNDDPACIEPVEEGAPGQ